MERQYKIKRIIGLVLVALSLGAICFWEFWGRENISYDSVAVLRSSVSSGTIIKESMIKERKVDKATEGAILYSEKDEISGLQSKQFIPQGAELHREYFEESQFQIGGESGKCILTIPMEWVAAYPQTIARGDKVIFYGDDGMLTSCVAAHVRDNSNQEISYDDERFASTSNVALIEVIVDEEQAALLTDYVRDEEKEKLIIMYE